MQRPEILWDRWGVPHIYALDEPSAAFGCAWAQMRAHGELIAQYLAQARGRAAEVYGEEFLDSDRRARTCGIPVLAERWHERSSHRMRTICAAWADGANAFARERANELSGLAREVFPVTATDVIAHTIRVLYFGWICPEAALGGELDQSTPPATGSNAWAIGPAASVTGKAMLMGNPHMPWSGFSLAFELHVVLPDSWTYGAALVGLPSFAFGFNDHLGWTHTVNTYRGYTIYELTPDGDGYRLDGERRSFSEHEETIRVRETDGAFRDERLTVRRSVHGPVVHHTADRTLALRIAGLDRPGALAVWADFARARSFEEFEGILRRMDLPGFNVVYADREGRIMELFGGLPPVRDDGDFAFWSQQVAGDRSDLIWDAYHDFDELPSVVDPQSGWLASSNEPPWYMTAPYPLRAANYPPYLAPERAQLGTVFRFQAGHRLLMENLPVSLERVVELRFSDRGEAAQRILDDLVDAARSAADPLARQAAGVLAAWDRCYEPDSRGAFLFALWLSLIAGRFPPDAAGLFAEPWDEEAPPLTVPRGLAEREAAVDALVEAGTFMREHSLPLDRRWGESVRMRAGAYDLPARGGVGLDTFRVLTPQELAPDEQIAHVIAGDSFIFAVEFSSPIRAKVLLTYGNASAPHDPHCGDQLELYARNEMRDALLWREDIERGTEPAAGAPAPPAAEASPPDS